MGFKDASRVQRNWKRRAKTFFTREKPERVLPFGGIRRRKVSLRWIRHGPACQTMAILRGPGGKKREESRNSILTPNDLETSLKSRIRAGLVSSLKRAKT